MLTTSEILVFLTNNKNVFENRFYCLKIGLFGSFARNEQTESTELELKKFIGNKFNRKVDICAEKWIKPIFKPMILKDTIYA